MLYHNKDKKTLFHTFFKRETKFIVFISFRISIIANSPVFFTADELSELVDESDEALRPAFLWTAAVTSLDADDRLDGVVLETLVFGLGVGAGVSSASSSLSSSLDSTLNKWLVFRLMFATVQKKQGKMHADVGVGEWISVWY